MNPLDYLHESFVKSGRVHRLAELLSPLLPQGCRVLDIGCGDGLLASLILQRRPDVSIRGLDVFCRAQTAIEVEVFDGFHLPVEDNGADVVLFVDVLHHAGDPLALLKQASRVATRAVLIKDHLRQGFLAGARLGFMDRVGNLRHGVSLQYNYWTKRQWEAGFTASGLDIGYWNQAIGLYPWPFVEYFFGGSLHFIARLNPVNAKQ